MHKILGIIYVLILISCTSFASPPSMLLSPQHFVPDATNTEFRNTVIRFIRGVAIQHLNHTSLQQLNTLDAQWSNAYQKTDWSVTLSVYRDGQQVGSSRVHGNDLDATLKKATELALHNHKLDKLSPNELGDYRFKVDFDYYPAHLYSFIEFGDEGLELVGSRVAIRKLDKAAIKEQIAQSQAYLLRSMHPTLHGFFKFYDAAHDKKESLLRTIYTSSSLYTLIKLYKLTQDPSLEVLFKPIAQFILSEQLNTGPQAGGFYYGLKPKTQKNSCLVVVGTTSKTIFTLLELHHFYPSDPTYLKAATKGGDWLLTMIDKNGKVTPIANCAEGTWTYNRKHSFLYSGQVLSALSRLYNETHDSRYYDGALKIAQQFLKEFDRQGPLVGDEYRPANSISSSWMMMAFIDFAKINEDKVYVSAIERIANTLLSRQITSRYDIFSNGRYLDAMTTSGNGWINEVMGNLYQFCQEKQLSNCERYRKAIILTSRWLLQNAYTPENTYNVKHPTQAIGGFMTNFTTQTVRTDAVCHGVNSLIALIGITGSTNHPLLVLAERPLPEILPLLRAGNGFISTNTLVKMKNKESVSITAP